ncbi:hypothetical protein KSP39_PZI004517 [Platanthera zijinensis]|uniref:Dihydrolipoamide acetyltransferase component of pyruvate dehydrogenase complex n=1 Tax=Platanthera zijinensis TaxID=2320716 RepID=A0AAP0BU70_9ASPA
MAGLLQLQLASSFLPSSHPKLRLRLSSTIFPLRRRPAEAKIREIFMPALSSTMTEGKIVSWMKSEGDKLSKGESVVVVESDKADMDVETFYDGYLAAIMVDAGDVASVGSAIALLAETEDEIPLAKSKASPSSSSSSSSSEASAPSPSPSPQESSIAAVVSPHQEKSTTTLASPAHPASDDGRRIVATPYAKKLAKDLKVELRLVSGTGPMGRIVAKDVEAAVTGAVAAPTSTPSATAPSAPAKVSIEPGSVVPFSTMQGAVSRNMLESLSVPTFRVGYTFTTNALDELYSKIKSKGVTMTALLAKATAMAIAKHPVINSCCRDGQSFTYNSRINIAVAVAIDGGLITPVLEDADKVDIYSLSRRWKELVNKARAKLLQPQEYNSEGVEDDNKIDFWLEGDLYRNVIPPIKEKELRRRARRLGLRGGRRGKYLDILACPTKEEGLGIYATQPLGPAGPNGAEPMWFSPPEQL